MRTSHRRTCASVLSAVLLLTACGSEALTREQYVTQGNGICRKAQADIEAVPDPGREDDEQAAWARRVTAIELEQLDDLRALEPLPELQTRRDILVATFNRALELSRDISRAVLAGDQTEAGRVAEQLESVSDDATRAASDLGLGDCSFE